VGRGSRVRGNFSPSKGYSLQNSPFAKGGQGDLKSPQPLFTKEGNEHPVLSGHPSERGECIEQCDKHKRDYGILAKFIPFLYNERDERVNNYI